MPVAKSGDFCCVPVVCWAANLPPPSFFKGGRRLYEQAENFLRFPLPTFGKVSLRKTARGGDASEASDGDGGSVSH